MCQQPEGPDELVLSREEIRRCDQIAVARYGLSGLVLMENAGAAAAQLILAELAGADGSDVCIIAGPGNNGGDGFVVARHLHAAQVTVDLLICAPPEKFRGDALSNLAVLQKMGFSPCCLAGLPAPQLEQVVTERAGRASLVVDAMLGTGAAGPPREPIRTVINLLNSLNRMVVALDIPSGFDCDTGHPLGLGVKAQRTITFAALKKGFLNHQASIYTGPVSVASIGIDTALLLDR